MPRKSGNWLACSRNPASYCRSHMPSRYPPRRLLLTVICFPLNTTVRYSASSTTLSCSYLPDTLKSRLKAWSQRPLWKHWLPLTRKSHLETWCSFIKWSKYHLLENVSVRIKWEMHIKLALSKYWVGDGFVINSAVRKIFSDQKIGFRRSWIFFPKVCSDFFYYKVFTTLEMVHCLHGKFNKTSQKCFILFFPKLTSDKRKIIFWAM